jgi:hypothetical protein
MKKYIVESTRKTPSIILDPEFGTLDIRGRSIPEDALAFYSPLFDALVEYSSSPKIITTVNLFLEYLLTSSAKCILEVLKILKIISQQGHHISINWYYEEVDEDMRETGKDFQKIINLPFNMLIVKEAS